MFCAAAYCRQEATVKVKIPFAPFNPQRNHFVVNLCRQHVDQYLANLGLLQGVL